MKFTCLREDLLKNLSIVVKTIPLKHSFPILTNVLLVAKDGRLKISGTNLSTAISTYIGVTIDEEGSITVPAKQLLEFVTHLSSETITFTLSKGILTLKSGKTKSTFNGINAEDYPELQEEPSKDDISLSISAKDFYKGVTRVAFSVAADESRPVFSGIYLNYEDGDLTLVGSDGFRLTEVILTDVSDGKHNFSLVLPAKTVTEISKIFNKCEDPLEIFVNNTNNLCLFKCDDVTISSRLIEGSYPDYKKIIPMDPKTEVTLLANDLYEAVKLTNIFSRGSGNSLRLDVKNKGNVKIASESQELGSHASDIAATVEGEDLSVLLDARYLLEFLTSSKQQEITLKFVDAATPCLIIPVADGDYLHVLAPIQANT